MDVLARCVEPPVQGDLRKSWSKSKSRHGGKTLDNFVVDLGSALEDALVLFSTSEQTEQQEESLESREGEKISPNTASVDVDDNIDDDQSPLDSTYSSSWTFHGSSKKLISAMKGSRRKRGRIVGKRRVSWAPDVYDPPVTSQSHSVGSSSSHNQHSSSRHKKNNNNKNKAKPQKNSRKSKR
ncbi:uncharacterized protein LOC124935886 [Impatiens glandulifera]|uniref:uncharacterized protein LOC124935886 n=1 Tax=Impatiens glandulifera TaxID=253017 RepID=UPI001FB13B73|nr:uncharacterized protein LOC124935886 [Impatiens glandulifera]XP_047332275.1 uncharacterized protein LOC124935886 [Impatiens glandulifera]